MSKIVHEDGRVTYYYYKKKKGRHKKTGPKKKLIKKKKYKKTLSWDFKILACESNKQTAYIGKYHTLGDVEKAKNALCEKNDCVLFPVKYVNNKRNESNKDYKGEYLVMKRIKDGENITTSLLRNEYGKIVEHRATSTKWYIYDKFPMVKEETFWVYGFNPRTERKNFREICELFIENEGNNIVQIYIYNNKVIFRYDFDRIEFVICKCVSDAIRMYNIMEERYRKNRNVIFTGYVSNKTDRVNDIITLLKEKTGWKPVKIYKKTTF